MKIALRRGGIQGRPILPADDSFYHVALQSRVEVREDLPCDP
jgi:hypothetical protein